MYGFNWNDELTLYLWNKGWLQVLDPEKRSTNEKGKSL